MVRLLSVLLCMTFSAAAGVKVGQPAPEISLDQLLPDQPVANASLRALKGKAVVLEFWATWCGPCVTSIPHLNQLAVQFKDKPVVFLSITQDGRAAVESFLKKLPIEGWVGLAGKTSVLEDYGVTGLARTILIDATGNVAADMSAFQLKAEMLDDLLAQRPVVVPKIVPLSAAIRLNEDPLSQPLLDVVIRPTTVIERGGGTARGKDNLMMKGTTLRGALLGLYLVPPTRMTGEVMEDRTRYDMWISLPGANREALNAAARDAICTAFRLNVRKETRESDVYLLKAPNGKPAGLSESKLPGFSIFTKQGKGSLSVKGPFLTLARMIETALGKPVIDETGITDSFEINLKYQDGVDGSLEDAVQTLGLKLEAARRPIEFMTVTKAQ